MRIIQKHLQSQGKGKGKLEKAQEFINDWYSKRLKQILNNIAESMIFNLDVFNLQLERLNNVRYISSSNLPKSLQFKHFNDANWYDGVYFPEIHSLYINSPSKLTLPIFIHEAVHSLQPDLLNLLIKKHIKLKDGVYHDDYLDHPDEINSRLMEFRYNNNLDPNRRYTIDEIKNMMDQGSEPSGEWLEGRPTDLLDRYSDDFLLWLVNDLASNKSTKNNV